MAPLLLSEGVSAVNSVIEDYKVQASEPTGASQTAAGIPAILDQIVSSELAVRLVPERLARRHLVVPIAVDNRVLTYATCRAVQLGSRPRPRLRVRPANRRRGRDALGRRRGARPLLPEAERSGRARPAAARRPESAKLPGKQAESAAIEMCTQIIGRAVDVGASEVHLVCDDRGATLRYLIDGVFEPELTLPTAADSIRDRFKIMARVGVAVRNRPQTGNVPAHAEWPGDRRQPLDPADGCRRDDRHSDARPAPGRHGGVVQPRSGRDPASSSPTTSRSRGC